MRKVLVAALVMLALSGCYCRRCQGQERLGEAIEPKPAEAVVVNATEVIAWKKTIYQGLNSLTRDPFSAICDLLLTQAFGLPSVPTGKETVSVPAEGHARMLKVQNSVNAALGFALVNQARLIDQNTEAVSAAIDAATDTIKDEATRKVWLQRAKLLRGE